MIALLLSIILLLSSYIPTFATDSSEVLEYSSTYNSGERDEICYTLDGTSADVENGGLSVYFYYENSQTDPIFNSQYNTVTISAQDERIKSITIGNSTLVF